MNTIVAIQLPMNGIFLKPQITKLIGISSNPFLNLSSPIFNFGAMNSVVASVTANAFSISNVAYKNSAKNPKPAPTPVMNSSSDIIGTNITNATPTANASNPFVDTYSFDFSTNFGAKNMNSKYITISNTIVPIALNTYPITVSALSSFSSN